MSVINQMLKDLEARRQPAAASARYQPRARQPLWLIALITLTCLGALLLLGWRSWLYWQLSQQPLAVHSAPTHPAPAPLPALPAAPPAEVDAVVALPTPGDHRLMAEPVPESVPLVEKPLADAGLDKEPGETQLNDVLPDDELIVPPGEDPEQFYARLDAQLQPERQAEEALLAEPVTPTAPPKNRMKVEQVTLSHEEQASLADKKASIALAKGDAGEAERQYRALLLQQPRQIEARKQLAALLYGQGRLDEASALLQEGVRHAPVEPDFRLLLARIAIAGQQPDKALSWLAGARPPLADNLDYYATWAALAQELGHGEQARELYLQLLRTRPDEGRWWLGLGIAEESLGNLPRALDAYRSAQLHGGLGEATGNWLAERVAQLSPHNG